MTDAEQVILLRAVFDGLLDGTIDPTVIGRRALACGLALDCHALENYSVPGLAGKLGISRQAMWQQADKYLKDLAEIKANHLYISAQVIRENKGF